jgi:hypothetical protein
MASDGSKARPSRPGGAGLREALTGRAPGGAASDIALGLPSIAAARVFSAREGLTTAGDRGRGRARRRMRALGTAATELVAVRPRISSHRPLETTGRRCQGRPANKRQRRILDGAPMPAKATPARLGRPDDPGGRRRTMPSSQRGRTGPAGRDGKPAATGGGRYHYRGSGRIGKRVPARNAAAGPRPLCPRRHKARPVDPNGFAAR